MGHQTSKDYLKLQKRLEHAVQGTPASESLFKFLEILFTSNEASLVSVLPLNLFTVKKASKIWKKTPVETKQILDTLADKGIFLDIANNKEQYYVLAPPMAGFIEFSLMRTDGKFNRKILSELYYQYINIEDNFVDNLFSLDPPIDRVFIQENTIKKEDQSVILNYEKASQVIETATCITVGTCYCRHKLEHVGKACDQPQNVCLSFNNAAQSLAKHKIAKKIKKEEAHQILDQCIANGLVQVGDNIQDKVNWICNCCGCCCEALLAVKKLGHRKIKSNYISTIEKKNCTGCGICAKKCPVDAITIKENKANIIKENCIGCGVCANFCPTKTIFMKRIKNTRFVPKDSFERIIITAINENKLQNYIFDNYNLWTYELLRKLLKTILSLEPVKRKLAQQQLRSRYLNLLTKSNKYSHCELNKSK